MECGAIIMNNVSGDSMTLVSSLRQRVSATPKKGGAKATNEKLIFEQSQGPIVNYPKEHDPILSEEPNATEKGDFDL